MTRAGFAIWRHAPLDYHGAMLRAPDSRRTFVELTRILALGLAPALLFAGCAEPRRAPARPPTTPRPSPPAGSMPAQARGLILVLPGIEGGQWAMGAVLRGLRDGLPDAEVRVQEWGLMLGGLANLMGYERNRAEAARIARDLADYARGHAQSPIQIVGYSGGGGMAIMLAEALPQDVRLRNIVLVHAAISRDYDLCKALARVDGKIINMRSSADVVILGAGTTVCGNMDGGKGPAAGKDGFLLEDAVPDAGLRARLREVPWSPEMRQAGHGGGHFEILGYQWNRQFVAPYLRVSAE